MRPASLSLAPLLLVLAGCADVPLPRESDWTDYGTIFEAGAEGEWDHLLWGGFATSVIKKDGAYFLYYQGASHYRSEPDGTAVGRKIGLATSPDGIRFEKHTENPIFDWRPYGNEEEGAASSGVFLSESGEVTLFYGANTEETDTTITADGRVAVSADGIRFTDVGVALDRTDPAVWGSGDELFPILGFRVGERWIVYYLPNGPQLSRQLGVAWGDAPTRLTSSAPSRDPGTDRIPSWGTGGVARFGDGRHVVFLNQEAGGVLDARLVDPQQPDRLSRPVRRYRFDDFRQATVYLDEERRTWFLYYRDGDSNRYGVKLAPWGEPDTTPPSAPPSATAVSIDGAVRLRWDPAEDVETGIAAYRVYRDGEPLLTASRPEALDDAARPGARYEVAAVNFHGVEGPRAPAHGEREAPRFTDLANGAVRDERTGLIWLQDASCLGRLSWGEARSAAATLADGACGLRDGSRPGAWRMPSLEELESLVDLGNLDPALPPGHPFSGVRSNFYWSATTATEDPDIAWNLDLGNGIVDDDGVSNAFHVWPVRGPGS
jgi:hypothetical protein